MATLNSTVLSLLDWAKRLDPDGKTATVVELLSQMNEMLPDMLWKEGNLPTGERTTIRTGLPDVYWRKLNQGTPTSKSRTRQVDEPCAELTARSNVDIKLAALNGNVGSFRLSEAMAFLEAMNQEMQSTVIYGNAATAPEEFSGLATRYSSLSADNAQNIINAGGAGADNTSIWLVVWGPNTVHGIFPKGSKAGLIHRDLGEDDVADADGYLFRAYKDLYEWNVGLALRDWRYAVRIANIDISNLAADPGGSTVKLQEYLIKAWHRIPNLGMGRPVIYCNRTISQYLDIQAINKANSAGPIGPQNWDGQSILSWRGIPIRTVDALLENESVVS